MDGHPNVVLIQYLGIQNIDAGGHSFTVKWSGRWDHAERRGKVATISRSERDHDPALSGVSPAKCGINVQLYHALSVTCPALRRDWEVILRSKIHCEVEREMGVEPTTFSLGS